jgi:23S rRNA pseudouridine1911/1915/1917 synthase
MTSPSESRTWIIDVSQPETRLDKYLSMECPELSRSRIQKLIEQGHILVNNLVAKVSQRLNHGDEISMLLPLAEPTSLIPEPLELDIVYEDNDLIVLNKPAGLTVHPAPGHTSHTLVNALLAYCPELAQFGNSLRPGIVHRLDKDTSGLMIIAKNSVAQQNLINQFKSHLVSKGYLVLVKGRLSPAHGIIDAPIGRHPANRKRMAIVSSGRQAKTSYKVKEYLNNYTLLEVSIETGRTHQIRVHFAAIGYPVIGDSTYGIRSIYSKRQFVHAYRLGFRLPSNGEYREFFCDLPHDLKQTLSLISQI